MNEEDKRWERDAGCLFLAFIGMIVIGFVLIYLVGMFLEKVINY